MLPKYISLNNVYQGELGQGIGVEVNATMVLQSPHKSQGVFCQKEVM
jgi:hypothetical protein